MALEDQKNSPERIEKAIQEKAVEWSLKIKPAIQKVKFGIGLPKFRKRDWDGSCDPGLHATLKVVRSS